MAILINLNVLTFFFFLDSRVPGFFLLLLLLYFILVPVNRLLDQKARSNHKCLRRISSGTILYLVGVLRRPFFRLSPLST